MITVFEFLLPCVLISGTLGHGRLMQPPARNSMWRYGFHTPVNYNDCGINCGGIDAQWKKNDGKCGECGDDYALPRPRPNEDGGKYGTGTISKNYTHGQVMEAGVQLIINHKGWFEFRICPNNDIHKPVEQSCLDNNLLHIVGATDSPTRYHLQPPYPNGWFNISLQLPPDLTCSQCVFQWYYRAGNNWGICPNGTGTLGCGPQETIVNCADVAIF